MKFRISSNIGVRCGRRCCRRCCRRCGRRGSRRCGGHHSIGRRRRGSKVGGWRCAVPRAVDEHGTQHVPLCADDGALEPIFRLARRGLRRLRRCRPHRDSTELEHRFREPALKRQSEGIRGNQRQTEANRGKTEAKQRHTEAYRGNPWPSEAIRGKPHHGEDGAEDDHDCACNHVLTLIAEAALARGTTHIVGCGETCA